MPARALIRSTIRLLKPIAVAVLLLVTVRSSFADHYHVPTGSMEPTVSVGDRIFVNKLAYGLRLPLTELRVAELGAPERGDVVVLESPTDGTVLLKRVVALPGEVVTVRRGRVIIDGAPVPVTAAGDALIEGEGVHAHVIDVSAGGGPNLAPTRVPAGEYLVMGDNRGNSLDGRSFGFVSGDAIFGRAEAVFMRDGDFVWQEL